MLPRCPFLLFPTKFFQKSTAVFKRGNVTAAIVMDPIAHT
jgi:hypothetical protein